MICLGWQTDVDPIHICHGEQKKSSIPAGSSRCSSRTAARVFINSELGKTRVEPKKTEILLLMPDHTAAVQCSTAVMQNSYTVSLPPTTCF
jgi:hypothetical protein